MMWPKCIPKTQFWSSSDNLCLQHALAVSTKQYIHHEAEFELSELIPEICSECSQTYSDYICIANQCPLFHYLNFNKPTWQQNLAILMESSSSLPGSCCNLLHCSTSNNKLHVVAAAALYAAEPSQPLRKMWFVILDWKEILKWQAESNQRLKCVGLNLNIYSLYKFTVLISQPLNHSFIKTEVKIFIKRKTTN